MSDLSADYDALTGSGGAVMLQREVMRASGADAVAYLHSQVTQDVESMQIGESRWSFVLQPHGKVDGFIRLTRTEEDAFLIDFDKGQVAALQERLERFVMRTRIEFQPLPWNVLAVRCASNSKSGFKSGESDSTSEITVEVSWKGMTGYDLIGEHPIVPAGIIECDYEAYEALRIAVGFPVMGAELDHLTIPAEAGANELAINFSKGCYTGQELVARIDARGGNVPRHLRAVVFECDEHLPRGASIMPAGAGTNAKQLGSLTSVAFSPKLQKYTGLAMIRRDVLPPADAVIVWEDGPTPCRIEQLPLSP